MQQQLSLLSLFPSYGVVYEDHEEKDVKLIGLARPAQARTSRYRSSIGYPTGGDGDVVQCKPKADSIIK